MAKTSQPLRQGSNTSDAVPFVHRILHVLIAKEDFPKILVNGIHEELKDLRAQVHETSRAFLRDAAKRASPVLATLGLQLYMNLPLVGVIGAALGTAVAAAISAYEAHSARKRLLCGKRAHGLSFLLRLQRVL